ncbi:autotransporter outer membrane beta-barrel domain-containing protein [Tenacibaculum aiptasiae]|uniref:Autotransporter outer membrane beta-barrel domain-containing protein n=1 Tax=Tenacibaculum aiptasiae TaxID=426481 RepID=A0A7J5ALV1_9FLAO|nr:porin [Tenacibaculum aiptasiae]KAB1158567.1 autotransporter outer membrane beta-barrel domain-containing protein [Tenacibaculum aiptasiae]
MRFLKNILFVSLALTLSANAQEINIDSLKQQIKKELREEGITKSSKSLLRWQNFKLRGYGAINYYNNNFDTNPNEKNKVDPERLNVYLDYHFTPKIALKTEIEFEHGGTGSTLELETFEEGGEFEHEVESGGEVKLEQVYINFNINENLNVKVGRFKVQFGLAQNLDTPDEYFTSYRPEMENQLLPLGWYETGIDVYGSFFKGKLRYHVALVNGLDGTGFNSQNFIRDGHQTRFEMMNAENFAISTRLDYKFGKHKNTFVGFSTYYGNTSGNRPKTDIDVDAFLTMLEGHFSYNEHPLRIATTAIWGNLGNSEIVSFFNSNLSNNLGVRRTPVGKNALGFAAEVGYDILPFFTKQTSQMMLYPFVRYDYYDTMQTVANGITDNPRWERNVITGGFNWFVHPKIIIKAHYSERKLGAKNIDPVTGNQLSNNQIDKIFSTGIGFTF